jgi:hypothetical protein
VIEALLQDGDLEVVLEDGIKETVLVIGPPGPKGDTGAGLPEGYSADFTTNPGFITYFFEGVAIKKIRLLDL